MGLSHNLKSFLEFAVNKWVSLKIHSFALPLNEKDLEKQLEESHVLTLQFCHRQKGVPDNFEDAFQLNIVTHVAYILG